MQFELILPLAGDAVNGFFAGVFGPK